MQWVRDLVGLNYVALLDVAIDIEQERQLATNDIVQIPLFQQVVKFTDLLPADSSGLRDRYCELRLKATQLLETHGAVREVHVLESDHRWESLIELRIVMSEFEKVRMAIELERDARVGESSSAAPSEKSEELLPPTDKITIGWLLAHVPLRLWASAVALLIASFVLGARLSEIPWIRVVVRLPPLKTERSERAGRLEVLPGDLVIPVGHSPTALLRVSCDAAATGADISIRRSADIVKVNLHEYNFAGNGLPTPRLLSVSPDRAVFQEDAPAGHIAIDFEPLSLIPRANAFSHLNKGGRARVGEIVLRLHYRTAGQERSLDIPVPVFVAE